MIIFRRQTASYIRKFIKMKYELILPNEFKLSIEDNHRRNSHVTIALKNEKAINNSLLLYYVKLAKENPMVRNGRPLRILFMSRGTLGYGRQLRNEAKIANLLRRAGGNVLLYKSDKNKKLVYQLSMAYYADVVRRHSLSFHDPFDTHIYM